MPITRDSGAVDFNYTEDSPSVVTGGTTIASTADRYSFGSIGALDFSGLGTHEEFNLDGASGDPYSQVGTEWNLSALTQNTLWELVDPDDGAGKTYYGQSDDSEAFIYIWGAVYNGVDQITPRGTVVVNSGSFELTTGTATASISADEDDFIVGFLSITGGENITVDNTTDPDSEVFGYDGFLLLFGGFVEKIATTTGTNTITIDIAAPDGFAAWQLNVFVLSAASGGSTTYDITPSGGVVFAGAPPIERTSNVPVSGGITFGGALDIQKTSVIPNSGGITFGGAIDIQRTSNITPANGITFGGAPNIERTSVILASGGIVFSGTGDMSSSALYIITPSGGIVFGGEGVFSYERAIIPVGGIAFTGGIGEFVVEKVIVPNGGIDFSGAVTTSYVMIINPTGGITFAGTANISFSPAGGGGDVQEMRISVAISRKMSVS